MTVRPFGRVPGDDAALAALYRDEMGAVAYDGRHPTEDAWVALATGTLDDVARDQVADHLVTCAECAAVYRAVADLQREASAIDPSVPRLETPASRWWASRSVLAAAALVVMAVGTGAVLLRGPRDDARTPPEAATTSRQAPVAEPAPVRPVIPAWADAVTAIDVRMPPALALTLRGDGPPRELVAALGLGLDRYRASDYGGAAAVLAPLASAHPDIPEVAFYAGLSYLLDGRADESLRWLTAAESSPLVGDDARWFAAVAHERMGEPRPARAILDVLCAGTGSRGPDACRVLGSSRQ